ncbi:MAG: CoA transferase [Chloroflexi bacterium]|nr:CoA transferase [Chloroflexota bacterium]
MPGVLEGIQVLDLATMWAAPLAAAYLADQGAQVVKVEPLQGDEARRTLTTPPLASGESRAWLAAGRGKRGIALDIARPAGREVVRRLVARSDVLLANFRPGVARRLGYDYETLRGINPRLVHVALTAYGDKGPYAGRRGYDRLVQALAGMLRQPRPESPPQAAGVWAADMSTPWAICYGVALALLHRERTGRGQLVETSLLHMALAMQTVDLVRAEREAPPNPAQGDYASQALFAPYRCADGLWLNLVVVSDREWQALCECLGVAHLAQDPQFAGANDRARHSQPLYELLEGLFATRPLAEWLEALQRHDVPCAPVLAREQVFDSPQVKANGMALALEHPTAGRHETVSAPLRLDAAPGPAPRRAPLLGEHTLEVLRELGYSQEEVRGLRDAGAI